MRLRWIIAISTAIALTGCGSSGPLPIQKISNAGEAIQIDYDPTQRTNQEMRRLAQQQCAKRGKSLKDVTVAPTASPTTSNAFVYCA